MIIQMKTPKAALNITTAGRNIEIWEAGTWDKCHIADGKLLVVERNGDTVGIYNMDSVVSVRKSENE